MSNRYLRKTVALHQAGHSFGDMFQQECRRPMPAAFDWATYLSALSRLNEKQPTSTNDRRPIITLTARMLQHLSFLVLPSSLCASVFDLPSTTHLSCLPRSIRVMTALWVSIGEQWHEGIQSEAAYLSHFDIQADARETSVSFISPIRAHYGHESSPICCLGITPCFGASNTNYVGYLAICEY